MFVRAGDGPGTGEAVGVIDVGAQETTQSGGRRLPRVPGFAEWPGNGTPKQEGKALRDRVPRSTHALLDLDPDRPDALAAVEESNRGRIPS